MEKSSSKQYDRWDIHQRSQHWMLVTSFTLLTVTGLLIKFANNSWAQAVAKIFGSFEILFAVHLVAAVLMTLGAVYHLGWLFWKASRRELRGTMLPGLKDARDIGENLAYFIGRRAQGARFAKYSYKEKIDYLAEYWGTPVMILTGLVLWFPGVASDIMPRRLIDSAHFIHQGEGLLAILVIFTWHMFSAHFSPDFFPMNRVWLTGKMSHEVMAEEYPLELARLEKEEGDRS